MNIYYTLRCWLSARWRWLGARDSTVIDPLARLSGRELADLPPWHGSDAIGPSATIIKRDCTQKPPMRGQDSTQQQMAGPCRAS